MILQLSDTTVSDISKHLVQIRVESGVSSLGRVLTLIIVTTPDALEEAVAAAGAAAREHPMRVVVVVSEPGESQTSVPPRLDAELRVGGDAGSREVIILRAVGKAAANKVSLVSGLLLPDTPVVTWWAGRWPNGPADDGLARLSQRRITDSGFFPDSSDRLLSLSASYRAGDTDLAWARLTLWRAQLAAALDNSPGREITHVTVCGTPDSSSTTLLAAWLRLQLGVPVTRVDLPVGASVMWGIHSVELHRPAGDIAIVRSTGVFAQLSQPGRPSLEVPLPRRPLHECLAEDLRLLSPDPQYGLVVTRAVPLIVTPSAEG